MPEPMVLVLEDGFTLFGDRGGQATLASGEVVINTCMTGYQEVLSDPSYAGQMVVMTYPLIGNYGAAPESGAANRRRRLRRQAEHAAIPALARCGGRGPAARQRPRQDPRPPPGRRCSFQRTG